MPVYTPSKTQVIPHQKAAQIVDAVNQARAEVLEAFKLLEGAKQRLSDTLGGKPGMTCYHLWERDISDYHLMREAEKSDALIARNAWHYLLHQSGMVAYMTDKRKEELDTQLREGTFPALTVENIFSTMEGLTSQVGMLLIESVKEVFDWLTPKYNGGVGALKTNKKFKVGYKVILGEMVEANYTRGYHLSYYRGNEIRALGNVLSLLDGQGVQQYPNNLETLLNLALAEAHAGEEVTLPYFTAKPHRNHNLHVTFVRHDLIDRLNQLGTDGSLGADTQH